MSEYTIDYMPTPTMYKMHMDDTSLYKLAIGPVRSGKSSAYCIEIMRRAMAQEPGPDGVRRTKFAIFRNTYRSLEDTTLATWLMWFPEEVFGAFSWGKMTHHIRKGDMDAEILFRALDKPKDIGKLLSLELTGAWGNEARELPWAVIDMIADRVGQYPSKDMGGCTWSGVLLDTNPPDDDHPLYHIAEEVKPDNWGIYKQPGALIEKDGKFVANPLAENIENLNEGIDYYLRRASSKKIDYVRIYYCGQYGFFVDGRPVHPEYADHVHCAETFLEPKPGLPLYIGIDWGLCYSDDTEVLTSDGWKLFKDVDETKDVVATLNPDGYKVEYTPINFKVKYDFDGELVQFKGQNFDFMVTEEHRTPYTDRDTPNILKFTSAGELAEKTSSHKYIQLRGEWDGGNIGLFDVPDKLFAQFMGWYISEGSMERNGKYARVSITQKKKCVPLDKLMSDPVWENIGCRFKKEKRGWRGKVPPELADYLEPLGHAHDKYVPQGIKDASSELIRYFLFSYVQGDGHIRSKSRAHNGIGRRSRFEITAATVSDRLKDDLQELALKAGWCSSTRFEKPQTSTMQDGRKIYSPGIWSITFKRLARAEINANHVSRVPYKGKIYCLNVPYHTLYIRRNGRPCWNGNTPAATIGQQLPDGTWQVVDEVTTADKAKLGASDLADELNRKLGGEYEGYEVFIYADPAGSQQSQADKNTPFRIFEEAGLPAEPAHKDNDPELRREALRQPLTRLIDGKPGLRLSPRCKMLRKALKGGYAYKRVQVSGEERYKDVPDKNRYSHIAEACEYMLLGAGEGKSLAYGTNKDASKLLIRPHSAEGSGSWMAA